jgi:hypothetical protein
MIDTTATHVAAAVEAVLRHQPGATAEQIHATLWPYVVSACATERALRAEPPITTPDRRAKRWQYTVRFWRDTEMGPELVAETDPAVMLGTGDLPRIVADLAEQTHEYLPDDLALEETKKRLPQFRNNLGRASSAVLRIPYTVVEVETDHTGRPVHQTVNNTVASYMVQVDVLRLAE